MRSRVIAGKRKRALRIGSPSVQMMEPRLLLAGVPTLDVGLLVRDGSSAVDVDWDSTPEVCDWDKDGRKDLLVGQFTNGYIWFYKNQGTSANPSFNGRTQLRAGGQVITTSYG